MKKFFVVLGASVILMTATFFTAAGVSASAEEPLPADETVETTQDPVEETPEDVTEIPEETPEEVPEETPEEPDNTPVEPQEGADEEVTAPPEETPQENGNAGIAALVQEFIDELKEKYGAEWQKYYDAIIAEWGTVENYLLSLMPEDTPDPVKDKYLQFVDWTRQNWVILAGIGATILAVVAVVVYFVVKQHASDFVKKKFQKQYDESNKQSAALRAQSRALRLLLGSNPKTQEAREELEKTEGDLK